MRFVARGNTRTPTLRSAIAPSSTRRRTCCLATVDHRLHASAVPRAHDVARCVVFVVPTFFGRCRHRVPRADLTVRRVARGFAGDRIAAAERRLLERRETAARRAAVVGDTGAHALRHEHAASEELASRARPTASARVVAGEPHAHHVAVIDVERAVADDFGVAAGGAEHDGGTSSVAVVGGGLIGPSVAQVFAAFLAVREIVGVDAVSNDPRRQVRYAGRTSARGGNRGEKKHGGCGEKIETLSHAPSDANVARVLPVTDTNQPKSRYADRAARRNRIDGANRSPMESACNVDAATGRCGTRTLRRCTESPG